MKEAMKEAVNGTAVGRREAVRRGRRRIAAATLAAVLLRPAAGGAPAWVFPADPRAVIDVRRDCGARGDGLADDTDALQTAFERAATADDHTRVVFLPAGTYRVTRTLVFRRAGLTGVEGAMVGPWVRGAGREATVIRRAGDAAGFDDPEKPRELLRCLSRPDGAQMNADFFDRTVVGLTLDTGAHRGAVGVKFYSNNTGLLQDVLIRGRGVCGLDLGFNDQNGPLLVQDVEIDGFATGVKAGDIINSQTLSRLTVRNADVGLDHEGQVLAVEGLRTIGVALPVRVRPLAVLALADAELLRDGAPAGPAIALPGENAHVYVQRLTTRGYAPAISAVAGLGGDVAGPVVAEHATAAPLLLGTGIPAAGLGLRPPPEPAVPYPQRAEEWVCVNDFGAVAGDEEDDAPAFQAAVDEAARRGASHVYVLGGKSGDPNWYHLRRDVVVTGSVCRLMGFGHVRILGGAIDDPRYPENLAKFVVAADSRAPRLVMFEHLQVFSPWPSFGIEARDPARVVVCRSTGGTPIVRRGATVFLSNCVGHLYQEPGSTVWARQWNTEGGPGTVGVNTRNDGGRLWILGMKTEAKSTKVATLNGGRTEILGVLNYNCTGVGDDTPFFLVRDAVLSVAAYREVCFVGAWWPVTVRAETGGRTETLPRQEWRTWTLMRAGGAPARPGTKRP